MILGTSVAGILRRAFEEYVGEEVANEIFGTKGKDSKNLVGSRLVVSNALLVDENGMVCEELLSKKSKFLQLFDSLPIRDHVAINANGTAKDAGKFDEEVVFSGSRFKFSLELAGTKDEFERILNLLSDPALRLGGGSSKGFGALAINDIKWGEFDLYNYKSSLNDSPDGFVNFDLKNRSNENFLRYELAIAADDFFMFGSGFGDADADHTPVTESVVDYETKELSKQKILIPASSIKGALSHRTAFHYNKIKGKFENDGKVDSENEAVREIFGYEKNKNENGAKGKILISDCFLNYKPSSESKVFEHVSIDRFTGGAIDAALFQEKAVAKKDKFAIEILLRNSVSDDALSAFEQSLDDVVKGRLLLGGATTKGYGFFKGEARKNGGELELKNEKK